MLAGEISKKNLYLSFFSAILALLASYGSSVFAADIQITSYVEGGLTLEAIGKWGTNMQFAKINLPMTQDLTRTLPINGEQDYFNYIDDTGTAGFHVKWRLTNFIYTGESQTQGPISASNFKIYAKHDGTTASALTKGYDDATKNLSILPNSCGSATVDAFTFHANFTDGGQNYSLNGSTSDQTIVVSTVGCLNIGHMRFDMAQLIVPQSSELGNYKSTLTWTAVDGLP